MNASTSYVSTFPDEGSAKRTEIFLWTMLAIAVIDVFMVLWIFQPWAHPERQVGVRQPVAMQASVNSDKPSPLGAIAPHRRAVAPKARVATRSAVRSASAAK